MTESLSPYFIVLKLCNYYKGYFLRLIASAFLGCYKDFEKQHETRPEISENIIKLGRIFPKYICILKTVKTIMACFDHYGETRVKCR
jgi:hypothetical protein